MNDYGGLDETGKSYSVLPTARRTMRPRAGLRSDVLPRKGAGGGTVQAGAITAAVTGSDFLISNAGRVKVICLSHKVFVYFTANPKIRAVLLPGQMLGKFFERYRSSSRSRTVMMPQSNTART